MKPHATALIVGVLNWPFSGLRTHEEEVKTKLCVQNLQTTGITIYIKNQRDATWQYVY
jgi:hypothetical protein